MPAHLTVADHAPLPVPCQGRAVERAEDPNVIASEAAQLGAHDPPTPDLLHQSAANALRGQTPPLGVAVGLGEEAAHLFVPFAKYCSSPGTAIWPGVVGVGAILEQEPDALSRPRAACRHFQGRVGEVVWVAAVGVGTVLEQQS